MFISSDCEHIKNTKLVALSFLQYLQKIKGKDPLTVLSHHSARVNSVKWLHKQDGSSTELISCSADKTVVIWTLIDRTWTVTATLEGHKNGVMCIHGTYYGDKLLVFSGSIDSTVKVWERNKDGWYFSVFSGSRFFSHFFLFKNVSAVTALDP